MVTCADRVFNEKKGTPHPPQAVPLPRWGRQGCDTAHLTDKHKFESCSFASSPLPMSEPWGRSGRVAAPDACERGGDLISPRAAYATLRMIHP